jgi:hypothetical protein
MDHGIENGRAKRASTRIEHRALCGGTGSVEFYREKADQVGPTNPLGPTVRSTSTCKILG